MAANTIQDMLVNYLKDATQIKKTMIAKILALLYGILTVALAYFSQFLTGPVTQLGQTAFGAAGGPFAGMFFLGAIFPQANAKGAFTGGIISITLNMWIAVGSFISGRKPPLSMPVSTTGCFQNESVSSDLNVTSTSGMSFISIISPNWNYTTTEYNQNSQLSAEEDHLVLYDLSYMWFGLIGFLTTIIVGMVISVLTGKDKAHPTEPIYIFPFLRRVWTFNKSTLHVRSYDEYSLTFIERDVDLDDKQLESTAILMETQTAEKGH